MPPKSTKVKKEDASESKKTWGSGGLFQYRSLGSLTLMLLCPGFVILSWYTCHDLDGSLLKLYEAFMEKKFMLFYEMWPTPFDPLAWRIILSYMFFELMLMRFVPGKVFVANPTPTGHTPVYNANGVQCYLVTVASIVIGGYFDIIQPAIVYDKMGELLSSMNVFAILFCLFLTIKGLNFPSTKDSGSNNDLIVDYFWGTELYPRVLGWDVKQFTNCRFGMMFWQVGLICYAFKQYEDNGAIASSLFASVIIQSVYIAKFFWWETGYFKSMDIQHDRAGYYICWGCMVWVPSMYTIHTYWMVKHPIMLSVPVFSLVVLAGIFFIWVNYDCDRQRQEFRETNGKILIWGREPKYIKAHYMTGDGEARSSLLLADGWWGLARHFHYIPEILASFMWCLPAIFENSALPYFYPFFYPIYLTLLLLDRAWRDDARCAAKYKKDWDAYCNIVPSKIIPGIV